MIYKNQGPNIKNQINQETKFQESNFKNQINQERKN